MGQCFSRLYGNRNISTAVTPGISPTTLEDQRNPPQTESDFTRAQSGEQFSPDATTNQNSYANPQPVDIDTIRDDIFVALKDGMVGKKSEEIMLPEVVSKIWAQNRHRKFYVNQAWYDPEWDRTNFMDEMIRIMSILIRINFRRWERFGAIFVGHGNRRDQNLPFGLRTLQQADFLGRSEGALFHENQFAFCPIPIPEQEDEFVLNSEERLPWIDEPQFVGEGSIGQVNKRTVAKGFLRFQNRTTNMKSRAVAVKTLSGSVALKEEFKNLKELRECLSAHTRIMVNLVTMVERSEPTDIYHIVYELAAYDLNVFLTTMRYDLRKIRHATASPERTGSVNMWPGDLISESVNLADALDYLHNRLISSKLHSSLSHNDIKPENILVVYPETTSDRELYPVGQWKLADFGLSKMKVKRSSGGHSRHLSAGNPPFLSSYPQRTHRTERPKSVSNDIPERYPGMYTAPELDQETPREADCRNADVWSFGCVLSEIVTYAVNLDFQQVVSFRDSLLQSSPADSKFYNKRSKDVKSEFIDHLARLPNTTQSITRISSNALWTNQCVDLIRKIVVKEPGNRLGPSKIREKLSQIGQAMHSGREEWLKHSPPPPLTVDISAANTEMAVSCPTSIMSQSPTEYTNPDHEREGPITRIPSITIHPVEHASSDPIQAPHSKETSTQAIYQGVEAGGRTISNFGDTIGNYRGRTLFDSSRRKEDIVDKVLGVEHPDTLTSTANLASTFWYQKRLEEAEKLEGPRPQSQDEKMPTETQCCHNASQRHILTDMSRELIETPESIYGLLPDSLKSGVQFDTNGLSGQFPGTWTCRPLDDNEPASYPLTIAGAPVVIPVDYRWPPTGGVSPPPDPRSSKLIDCYAEISVDIARDIFLTFEGCVGFYLLINGILQIIVPGEFDIAVAASCMPHTYGGLKICYINIKRTLEPTMFPTRTQSPQTNTPIQVRSMPPLSINDTISAATVKNPKRRFDGKIGLRVLRGSHSYLVMSSHVITEAITARTLPMMSGNLHIERLKKSWKDQVEISAENVKMGTIEKSYDEGLAELYPQGFTHDITLINPLDPSLVENVKSPIGGLTWLDQRSWSSLRQQSLLVRFLGPRESDRDAKTLRCCHDSEVVIVGEGIFLNVRGSKALKDLDRSVWKSMVSRAVLYRLSPDFDSTQGNSGMALYADSNLENGKAVKGVIGFQSFVQRSDHFGNFEAEGDELEQRLKAGRIAFYGAFQLPDDLRVNYTIAC